MSYRDKFYNRPDAISKLGLVRAPVRETPSHELVAARELEQREMERERALDAELAEQVRKAARQRLVDELRPFVAQYGARAVVKITRQVNPAFELPHELDDSEKE